DIDSDNNDGIGLPAGDAAEEAVEDVGAGKLVPLNTDDADHDGIKDLLDGYDGDSLDPAIANHPADDLNVGVGSGFVPLVINLPSISYPDAKATVALQYDDTALRIWKKDESASRDLHSVSDPSQPGDLIVPGGFGWGYVHTPADLGSGPLYVEGLKTGEYSIRIVYDADGGGIPVTLTHPYGTALVTGHLAGPVEDVVKVTVFNEVTITATDAFASERNADSAPDRASFTISRGTANTDGQLRVNYRLKSVSGSGSATDPLLSGQNADYGAYVSNEWGYSVASGYGLRDAISADSLPKGIIDDPYDMTGWVVIQHGSSSATINIYPVDDERIEWDEIVELELVDPGLYRAPSNPAAVYVIGAQTTRPRRRTA
ncbi:MAG: hypothetical protein ACYTHJ_22955, partial [Planctomycetota bacterium]